MKELVEALKITYPESKYVIEEVPLTGRVLISRRSGGENVATYTGVKMPTMQYSQLADYAGIYDQRRNAGSRFGVGLGSLLGF